MRRSRVRLSEAAPPDLRPACRGMLSERKHPRPPTAAEAAAVLTEAWADPDFGTLVMFAMTTGARRAEICALRWRSSTHYRCRGVPGQCRPDAGERWEKDTKTHTARRAQVDAGLGLAQETDRAGP